MPQIVSRLAICVYAIHTMYDFNSCAAACCSAYRYIVSLRLRKVLFIIYMRETHLSSASLFTLKVKPARLKAVKPAPHVFVYFKLSAARRARIIRNPSDETKHTVCITALPRI